MDRAAGQFKITTSEIVLARMMKPGCESLRGRAAESSGPRGREETQWLKSLDNNGRFGGLEAEIAKTVLAAAAKPVEGSRFNVVIRFCTLNPI